MITHGDNGILGMSWGGPDDQIDLLPDLVLLDVAIRIRRHGVGDTVIGVLDDGDVAALGVHEIPGGSGIDGVVQVHGCDGSLDDLTVANEIVTAFGQH